MNSVFESSFVELTIPLLGWTLLHFVWQASAIALAAYVVLNFARLCSSTTRYWIACSLMTLTAMCPIVTFICLSQFSQGNPSFLAEYFPHQNEGIDNSAVPILDRESEPQASIENSDVIQAVVQNVARSRFANWFKIDDKPANSKPLLSFVESNLVWLVAVWMIGVAFFAIRLVCGMRRVHVWRRNGVAVSSLELLKIFDEAKRKLKLNFPVAFLTTSDLKVPAVVGWVKPTILFPASMLTGLSGRELEAILAHELAHVRRYDFHINVLQKVLETMLFYHPAVWWISNQVRVERENCCDDAAVKVCGNRIEFVKALTAMETIRCESSRLVPTAMGANAIKGGSLLFRVKRLVGRPIAPPATIWPASAIAVLIIGSIFGGLITFGVYPNDIKANEPDATDFHGSREQDETQSFEAMMHLSVAASGVLGEQAAESDEKSETKLPDIQIAESDNGRITHAYVKSINVRRSPDELMLHFAPIIEQHGGLKTGLSITNMESVVSALVSAVEGNEFHSSELVFSLPEGSKTQAAFIGKNIEIQRNEKDIQISITNGEVRWIDSVGVIRAIARPANEHCKLEIKCDIGLDEVVMNIRSESLVDNRKVAANEKVHVKMNLETGAPKNEEQPPHGSVRYQIFTDDEDNTRRLRMKMKWRYDIQRLAKEAEWPGLKNVD